MLVPNGEKIPKLETDIAIQNGPSCYRKRLQLKTIGVHQFRRIRARVNNLQLPASFAGAFCIQPKVAEHNRNITNPWVQKSTTVNQHQSNWDLELPKA